MQAGCSGRKVVKESPGWDCRSARTPGRAWCYEDQWHYKWYYIWYNASMNATLSIDKAGRVVLPKAVRDALQIAPGDSLELESSEDQIILRPARATGRMYKKDGMWVFDSGEPLSAEVVNRTLRQVRAERDRRNLGRFK